MYAIVEIAGQQFKVEKDQKVFVHRLQTEEGKKVAFDNVLLLALYFSARPNYDSIFPARHSQNVLFRLG